MLSSFLTNSFYPLIHILLKELSYFYIPKNSRTIDIIAIKKNTIEVGKKVITNFNIRSIIAKERNLNIYVTSHFAQQLFQQHFPVLLIIKRLIVYMHQCPCFYAISINSLPLASYNSPQAFSDIPFFASFIFYTNERFF